MEMSLEYVEYMIFSIHEILFETAQSFSRYMIFGSRCSHSDGFRSLDPISPLIIDSMVENTPRKGKVVNYSAHGLSAVGNGE
jgi:hypothetical protein